MRVGVGFKRQNVSCVMENVVFVRSFVAFYLHRLGFPLKHWGR